MSFLRRLFGGGGPTEDQSAPATQRTVLKLYDLPDRGYFEVAGIAHHTKELHAVFGSRKLRPKVLSEHPVGDAGVSFVVSGGTTGQEIVDVPADLMREPTNRYDSNAVRVQIQGRTIGYVPSKHSANWSAFLLRCEAEGYHVRAIAHVWIGDNRYYVHLRADDDGRYLTPRELEVEQERKAQEDAAKAAVKAAREAHRAEQAAHRAEQQAHRAEQEAHKVQAETWRAAGLCADCGGSIEVHAGGGRKPVYCLSCRAKRQATAST